MGRYKGTPDSVFGGVSFLQAGRLTNAVITGSVAAGELVVLHESGILKRADPNLPWSAINDDNAGPTILVDSLYVDNISISTMTRAKACGRPRRLTTGDFCTPLQTAAGIGFHVRSSNGLQKTVFININSDTSVTFPHVIPLANGNFVIVWLTSSSLKFAIYTPLGVQVVGPTTVATNVVFSGAIFWFTEALLGNGNFVLVWSSSTAIQAQIYTQAGATVGSLITIDAAVSGQFHACSPCANGDFIVAVYDAAHTAHKLYRITNAGVVSWGPFTPAGSATVLFSQPTAEFTHESENRLLELTGGNIAWVLPLSASGNYAAVFIINSIGTTLITTVNLGTSYQDAGVAIPIVLTPAGFACAHGNNAAPNTYVSYFDVNGSCLSENILVDTTAVQFPTGSAPQLNLYCGFHGSGIAISRYAGLNGAVHGRLLQLDHTGRLVGQHDFQPFLNPSSPRPSDMSCPHPRCDVDGMVHLCWFDTTKLEIVIACYKHGRSSVIGVAQAAATNGQAITTNSEGYFPLPATQIFGPGVAFDRRNSVPLGARGVVGGQNAWLFGWV